MFDLRMTYIHARGIDFFKHLRKQCVSAGTTIMFVNVMEPFEKFSKKKQEHRVVVDTAKLFQDAAWNEWFEGVLEWVRENTTETWSVHLYREENGFFALPHEGKLYVEFSFSDLSDAALFRLKF